MSERPSTRDFGKRPDEGARSLEERLQELSLRRLELRDVLEDAAGPSGDVLDRLPWREHGSPAQIERVWGRLEGSLREAHRRRSQRPIWGTLAAAAVFGLGVWAGRVTQPVVEPGPELAREEIVVPEPMHPEEQPELRERGVRPSAAPAPSPRRVVPRRSETRRNTPVQSVQPQRDEAPREIEAPAARPAASSEDPRWLGLADRGEYAAAFQAVDEAGGFDAVLVQSSAEELMTLADVARAAGQQGRAIQALRRVIQLYPDDPNAPVAAMMLGNLLQRAGDLVGAGEAYALNRSLSPQGDFAEDALAREFEVALETADLERARALATQYEREFPQGRRLGDIREQLARAQQERAAREPQGVDGRGRDGSTEGAVEQAPAP